MEIIETWQIQSRINTYLLQSLTAEQLPFKSGGKGRSVGEIFAHLHNVRLMWLKVALPDLTWTKLEKTAAYDPAVLQKALDESSFAIEDLLQKGVEMGRIKGFKPANPTAFLGYLIAHEAHHRGQITLILRLNGQPLDKKIGFGMWEWGVR